MFNAKSDYALNKRDQDTIIYQTALGPILLTRSDFDNEVEFRRWKDWSDQNYHQTEQANRPSEEHTANQPCGSLTASGTVDGDAVNMESVGDSANALVPLTVLNTRGFDLPKTGGTGTLVTTICGVLLVSGMIALAVFTSKRKRSN